MAETIIASLLKWFSQNARVLPWRGHVNPYAIWVSEIMLQQTRVETVIPYFERWMERFPTVSALAQASEEEVLARWEGLGYYARARNLHRASQIVVSQCGGSVPTDPQALQQLPGIGRYTAAAIASIAFGKDEAVLDGNVRRVLARLFDVVEPARSPQGERKLLELAADLLPLGQASEYNQALMDLGAMICTPRQPRCSDCPLRGYCVAFARGVQEQRPVKLPKVARPHHIVTAAVIRRDGVVLIARRPSNGLLGGLWEFPGGKLQDGEELSACLRREILEELGVPISVGDSLGVYRHAYTHFKVTLYAFHCSLVHGEPVPIQASELRWVQPGDLFSFPMGKLDRQIALEIQSSVE